MRRQSSASPHSEWGAAALLLLLGVGTRLSFAAVFPARPFDDSLWLIHFGTLLREHGLAARGWYWAQFNPGLPMILSLLFRFAPGDPISVARTATGAATGLLPLFPFLIWRSVLAFRWRVVAGLLLALWPGQIFFAGFVSQDNWVLLPAVALCALAARRLLDRNDVGHPLAASLLYVSALAIRQEMAVVLLPAAVAAATAPPEARRTRKNLAIFGTVAAISVLALVAQRHAATGRASIATQHGALALFGSLVPGASWDGWIDARAYAAALDPETDGALLGSEPALLRLSLAEARRRPAFHLLRAAAWFPRLAVNAESDNLASSLGNPRSQMPDRWPRAKALCDRWIPRLRLELALIQGLFLASVVVGVRRRNAAILLLAAVVALKFLVHVVLSPIGRLVFPAVAIELLTIPIAAAAVSTRARERLGLAALALSAAVVLLVGVPRLAAFVMERDSLVLPGVRRFTMRADSCAIRCELESGDVTGMAPGWTRLQASARSAMVSCSLPVLDSGDRLALRVEGSDADAVKVFRNGLEGTFEGASDRPPEVLLDGQDTTVTLELPAPNPASSGGPRSIVFGFDRRASEPR